MARKQSYRPRSRKRIEPIRDLEDFRRIKRILEDKPRDLLLFDLATQTGLTIKDLLTLKVKDLLGLKVGDLLAVTGASKRGPHEIRLNQVILESFNLYLEKFKPEHDDYLFKSRKGGKPLNISSVSHLIKSWFEAANIKNPCGAKSLRKTWEFLIRSGPSNGPKSTGYLPSKRILDPIQSFTLQERVYDQLFQAIISSKIPPGSRLTAKEISAQFNVSQMPVRHALGRLEAKGFVTSQKNRGIVVTKLTKENLREITTIRIDLESLAAEQACKNRTGETLEELESLLWAYAHAKDPEELFHVNKKFHYTIYRDAHMPLLQEFISGLWDRVSPYLHLWISTSESTTSIVKETLRYHQGMVDGMRRKNSEEVSKWVKADLSSGEVAIDEVLRNIAEKREIGRLST
jgi:DNA-binding GntR family transcriptional regulator